jgi:hypothetical protein
MRRVPKKRKEKRSKKEKRKPDEIYSSSSSSGGHLFLGEIIRGGVNRWGSCGNGGNCVKALILQ